MTANDRTESISPHYATPYQHWDLVIMTGMGYLNGNATKYVARWRKKNGVKDLEKALHYIDKILEICDGGNNLDDHVEDPDILVQVSKFACANALSDREADIILWLAEARSFAQLLIAREGVAALLQIAQSVQCAPVPVEDSNKHAPRANFGDD